MSPTGSPPAIAGVLHRQPGAHLAQGGEQAGAQRVQPDISHRHPRARHQQRRDQQEGGRGRVAGHQDRRRDQFRLAFQLDQPAVPRSSTRTVAPKWRSMFSVWSRVRSGSMIRVVPRAQSPASRQADFTWAEATGRV